ncbi:hypothetical protein MRS76_13365 [Rhizobiaceae bacterium n13]|uniref:Uncharacterized protein n=1 Tax=Ferirhizobium litorale TaxID=2927786 RepID=A0AAE3QE18_9HYPH|nr:hypothetical protein [Fererhizobium litorale]MDI7862947.1 hypothetical protein [Fererhizobium litorale]MDI7924032.1 hypothetical protein [Fererhizobium litorale]
MKHLIRACICLGLLVDMSGQSMAQQALISDPEIYEKKHFQELCAQTEFGPDFVQRRDINNDRLVDAVVNQEELTCEGEKGAGCDDDGCVYNFYLQVKEGGYFMIATARIYGYDFVKRFGNMVLVMKMHPRFCERDGGSPCEVTARVRGAKFVTIARK